MIDFKSEHAVLIQQLQAHLKEARKLPRETEGFDGVSEQTIQEKKAYEEYREKVEDLKLKCANVSVEKAKTFTQILQPAVT